MEDKITEVKEEMGEATLTYKDGTKTVLPMKTIETYYESGRKDCTVVLIKPIDTTSVSVKLEGGK